MTPARARQILANAKPDGCLRYDQITEEEDAAIRRVWADRPRPSTYGQRLRAIARGEPIPAEIPTDADGVPLHLPEADPLTIPEASYQPGYPGPCPEGMDWSRWLAMNNVD